MNVADWLGVAVLIGLMVGLIFDAYRFTRRRRRDA